jgi:AbiV family abortive infection protein
MPKLKDRALTLSEVHSGYHAAIRQARSLVAEAKLLLEHHHVPGAFHRLVIALEELGKARLLFYQGAFTAGGASPEWKSFWKQYYSHESKLDAALTWLTIEEIAYSDDPTAISDLRAAIVAHAKELDRRKQSTSYSEMTEEGFSVPTAESYAEQVEVLFQMAEAPERSPHFLD